MNIGGRYVDLWTVLSGLILIVFFVIAIPVVATVMAIFLKIGFSIFNSFSRWLDE